MVDAIGQKLHKMYESSCIRLALFDLDGTITSTNIFLEFIEWTVGKYRFWCGLLKLSPWVLLLYSGAISATRIKEIFITYFFGGMTESEMRKRASDFNRHILPSRVRPAALSRIRWHQARGDIVFVVSACIDMWIEDWCKHNGLSCIATRLVIHDGRITGTLEGENCSGEEKVRRITAAIDISKVTYIFAYGDTKGDRQMLELANEGFYRYFE